MTTSAFRHNKHIRRATLIIQNSFHRLIVPVLNILISSLVIRFASEAIWGAFVGQLVLLHLIIQIAAWGNRDYLLREFSRHPAQIIDTWQINLFNRLLLYLLLCLSIPLWARTHGDIIPLLLWGLAAIVAQSFDVANIYARDFTYAIMVEFLTTAVIAITIVLAPVQSASGLIMTFMASQSLRATLYVLRYRHYLKSPALRLDPAIFRNALPFFLLGFSGMIASRIDLYTVSALLGDSETGRYQVFINMMLYLQSLSAFILLPYVKNIYRLADPTLVKIAGRLFILGIVLTVAGLFCAALIFDMLYDVEYSLLMMSLGAAFVLPVFAYVPLVHRLYRRGETRAVLQANIVGALANLLMNLWLLPEVGIIGAIFSSAIVQWAMLVFYLTDLRTSYEPGVPYMLPDEQQHRPL